MSPEPREPDLAIVDLLLGEGSEAERSELRDRIATEPALAGELAEVADVLDLCRSASVEPTGRVFQTMALRAGTRAGIRSKGNQRPEGSLPWWGRLLGVGGVAAAALAVLINDPLGLLVTSPTSSRFDAPDETPAVVRAAPSPATDWPAIPADSNPLSRPERIDPILPVDTPSFRLAYRQLDGIPFPDAFEARVVAGNELALLRAEFENRTVSERRREMIEALGGNPDIDDRVQELARVVARQITDKLSGGEASVMETSMALRALLASGSERYESAVRLCTGWLVLGLETMEGGELASALSALIELTAPAGRSVEFALQRHLRRLAEETVTRRDLNGHRRARPSLLSFEVPVASLADAGRLLYLAPAFLVPPDLAFEARRMVLAHLEERLQMSENAAALAAQLYGFGDLIARPELDRRLRMWVTTNLEYVTVHHLAWSQFPVRPGWARFQQDLRRLSAQPNPDGVEEASALLLCLAMNFAAPGSAEMLLTQQ